MIYLRDLDRHYHGCLKALRTFFDCELNLLAFFEAAVAIRLDSAEVDKDIIAIFTADKAVTLGCIEPLHCSFNTI